MDRVERKKERVTAMSVEATDVLLEVNEVKDVSDIEVVVLEATNYVLDKSSKNAPSSESSSRDRGLSGSYEGIDSLAEDCVVEENLETNLVRYNQNNELIPEHIGEVLFEVTEETSSNVTLPNEPVFNFTFEEEFKIYELVARKDSLLDAIFGMITEIPQFKMLILNFLSSGEFGYNKSSEQQLRKDGFQTLKSVFGINLNSGGKIRACLDMFDEYKHVDEEVKNETFDFSLKVHQICTR